LVEFAHDTNTSRILQDLWRRWSTAGDNSAYYLQLACQARKLSREGTPLEYAQDKILRYYNLVAESLRTIGIHSYHTQPLVGQVLFRSILLTAIARGDAILDIKSQSYWQYTHNTLGGVRVETMTDWERNSIEFMYFDGRLWSVEQLGNWGFGYVGAALLFSEEFLSLGAGVYQLLSINSDWSWWNTYFDDPIDNAYIRLGFSDYESARFR